MLVIQTNIPTPYRTAFFNQLNKDLAERNIDFHVLYSAVTEPRRYWEFDPLEINYKYTFLDGYHPEFRNFYPHFNKDVIWNLKQLDPKWIILAGSWNAPSVVHIALAKKSISAKLIFWSEGHIDSQISKSKIIGFFRKSIYKRMDAFLVPNIKSLEYARSMNSSASISIVPNTIDEVFFDSKTIVSKLELRRRNNIPEDKRVVVFVGTISNRKGSFELLQGYNLLNVSDKSNIYLIYIGTGELLEKLVQFKREQNLENVFFLGHQNSGIVKEYLTLADFFILPTKLDPNPLTPIEACFLRTPIILSKLAGNHDELIRNNSGYSINIINPEEIKERLMQVSKITEEEIEKMGINAYHNVKNNFSRKATSRTLIEFCKSL